MNVTRYPYKKIVKAMFDSIVEIVEGIESAEDQVIETNIFRAKIFEKMLEKDENLKEVFADTKWVSVEIVGETPDGKQVGVPVYDSYIESVFIATMEDFNEQRQDLIQKMVDLMKDVPEFKLAYFQMELYYTDEEYAAAKKEGNVLTREYAKHNNISMLKAKMQVPLFGDPFDLVEWLKEELKT